MRTHIPKIDYEVLCDTNHVNNKPELKRLSAAVSNYGFLIIKKYPINIKNINNVFLLKINFFSKK